MTRRRLLLAPIAALLAWLGATSLLRTGGAAAPSPPGAPPATPEEARLMRHVHALAHDSMEGRLIGTPGGVRARRYVVAAFDSAGLTVASGGRERPFTRRRFHVRPPLGPGYATYHGVNVVGAVPGTAIADRHIVVTAHYDHLGVRDGEIYNGADDNASGVAALIELARWFREHPARHSLLFVALDGEERGLLGARAFVDAPPVPLAAIAVNVNLDMVGRNAANELYVAGTAHYPALRAPLDGVAARAPVTVRFGHDRRTLRPGHDWTSSSDHGAFHERKIPFVYFGEEDHPDYHGPGDETDRIQPAFLAGATATVREAITALDAALDPR